MVTGVRFIKTLYNIYNLFANIMQLQVGLHKHIHRYTYHSSKNCGYGTCADVQGAERNVEMVAGSVLLFKSDTAHASIVNWYAVSGLQTAAHT
jgi:hypothetical protein